MHAFPVLTDLRKCCNHPDLLLLSSSTADKKLMEVFNRDSLVYDKFDNKDRSFGDSECSVKMKLLEVILPKYEIYLSTPPVIDLRLIYFASLNSLE